MLPGITRERPTFKSPRVAEIFSDKVVLNVKVEETQKEALISHSRFWYQTPDTPDGASRNIYSFIEHLNHFGVFADKRISNENVKMIANNLESWIDKALDLATQEWVLEQGIRIKAVEGDAVEFMDPETNFAKIGSVLAVDKNKARVLVSYRNKKDQAVRDYVNAERILKVYNKGVPTDNNPRGGKVGFRVYENVAAVAA